MLQPMSREPLALRQIPIREGDAVNGYVDLALERAYRYRPGAESELIEIPADIAEREQADRTRLLETLADFDDALMEALLMDEEPDRETVMTDLALDTAENKVVPVILGSALTGGGVRRLLKLLRHEAPAPDGAAARLGVNGGGALHVFKIANGGAMGRLALGRVLGEGLNEGDELVVGGEAARTGSIFFVQGEKTAKQGAAAPGDVVAVAKVDTARSGLLLGRKGAGEQRVRSRLSGAQCRDRHHHQRPQGRRQAVHRAAPAVRGRPGAANGPRTRPATRRCCTGSMTSICRSC